MTEIDDFELLAQFERRLAAIELAIPDPPQWTSGRVRGSTRATGLGSSTRPRLATATLVVVVAAIALLVAIPSLAGRAPVVRPTPAAIGSLSASPTPGIVFGPDGLPTSIKGESVLDVSDGIARAFVSKDATTFLVGGWLDDDKAACPPEAIPTMASVLLDTGLCGLWPALVGAPPYDVNGQPDFGWSSTGAIWAVFLPGSSPVEPSPPPGLASRNFAVVFRVHTHDPSAASCPASLRLRCDQAVVVDSVNWSSTLGRASSSPTPIPSPTFVCIPSNDSFNGASPAPAPCSAASWNAILGAVANLGYPLGRPPA